MFKTYNIKKFYVQKLKILCLIVRSLNISKTINVNKNIFIL